MKKSINIILIVIIMLLLILPGIIYINNNHNKNLWLVVEKEVVEAADRCRNEDKCVDSKITIKTLIDNEYLEKIYDPITKEAVNDASYVENKKLVIVE